MPASQRVSQLTGPGACESDGPDASAPECQSGAGGEQGESPASQNAPGGGGLGDLSSLLQSLGGFGAAGDKQQQAIGGGASAAGGGRGKIVSRFGAPFVSMRLNTPRDNYHDQRAIESGASANVSSMYDCPGDSFMVGSYSFYRKKGDKNERGEDYSVTGDRMFHAVCQFFQDGTGEIIKKTNCSGSVIAARAGAKDTSLRARPGNPYGFSCPDAKILSGMATTWQDAYSERDFFFRCCEARRGDGKKVTFLTPYNKELEEYDLKNCEPGVHAQIAGQQASLDPNANRGTAQFACQQPGFALSTIEGERIKYNNGEIDRNFSFICCQLGVPGETQPGMGGGRIP